MSSIKKIIGVKVRAAREEVGLPQIQLGKKAGYAAATISQLEAGKFRISVDSLEKIAKILKKPLHYFLPERAPLFHVIVSGNIGVGKRVWIKTLAAEFDGKAILTDLAKNPYLSKFYRDMKKWALPSELYFLMENFRLQKLAAKSQVPIFQDESFHEQFRVFIAALYEMKILQPADYQIFEKMYYNLLEFIPKPDLIIYLKAPIPFLLKGIQTRGMNFEQTITTKYLKKLNKKYDVWIKSFDLAPVLIFEANKVDLKNPKDLEKVVTQIRLAI